MALTELINTAAAIDSAAFNVATPTTLVASGFASGESCTVLVKDIAAAYIPMTIQGYGLVKLDALNNVLVLNAAGDYKVRKALTAGIVTVGYVAS